jgi:hypothetical protein
MSQLFGNLDKGLRLFLEENVPASGKQPFTPAAERFVSRVFTLLEISLSLLVID